MNARVLYRTAIRRRYIALVLLCVLGLGICLLKPFTSTFANLSFYTLSMATFLFRTSDLREFAGYGVAQELNEMVGRRIVCEFGGLAWGGLANQVLVRKWLHLLIGCAGMLTGAFFLGIVDHSTNVLLLWQITLLFIAIVLFALAGEIGTWIFIDRRPLWYLHEDDLRVRLAKCQVPKQAIDALVSEALKKGLIVH